MSLPYPNMSPLVLVAEPSPDSHAGYPWPERRLPLGLRLTMEQVLEVAEDADLRADMFGWLSSGTPSNYQSLPSVSALRQAARGLREIAAQLRDSQDDQRTPSKDSGLLRQPVNRFRQNEDLLGDRE